MNEGEVNSIPLQLRDNSNEPSSEGADSARKGYIGDSVGIQSLGFLHC